LKSSRNGFVHGVMKRCHSIPSLSRGLANPELLEHYPLVFNSGARTQSAFRSQHHNIPR
jgi:hypothetical protein